MSLVPLVEMMSLVLATLSAVATAYLAFEVFGIRRIYMREAKANKMERTLRAIQLPSSVSKTMDDILYRATQGNLDFEDSEVAADVRAALNYLETLATGILADVYDEEVAYSGLADSLLRFYDASRRFVYDSRSNFSSASLYVQLEHLIRRWESGDRMRPRLKERRYA